MLRLDYGDRGAFDARQAFEESTLWRRFWFGFQRLVGLRRRRHRTEGLLFCGKTGSAKTYSAVADAHRWDSPIYHNLGPGAVRPIRDGQVVYSYETYADLVAICCGTVILDEAQQVLSSRAWASLPVEISEKLTEQRKEHWRLLLITQRPESVDVIARELAHKVVDCELRTIPLPSVWPFVRRSLACRHCVVPVVGGTSVGAVGLLTVVVQRFISWQNWSRLHTIEQQQDMIAAMSKDYRPPKKLFESWTVRLFSMRVAQSYGSANRIDARGFARKKS